MTRDNIVALLRRVLGETTADNWTAATLIILVDNAYSVIQGEVKKLDREWNVTTSLVSIVSGTATYAKPTDEGGILEVNLLTGGEYKPARRVPYDLIRPDSYSGSNPSFSDDTVWYHSGRSIGLYPTPTASVTDGIQFRYVPDDVLANGSDEPLVPEAVQYAIVLQAALMALGETQQETAPLREHLARLLALLPHYYSVDDNGPQAFRPDVEGLRRGGINRRVDNDIV